MEHSVDFGNTRVQVADAPRSGNAGAGPNFNNVDSTLRIRYSTRVKMAMLLYLGAILLPSLQLLWDTSASFRALPQTDDISRYEQRFTGVRDSLPPNQVLFYRDEFDKFSSQCTAYVLAQYSLAPTVLAAFDSKCRNPAEQVSSPGSQLVLENFNDPSNEPYLLDLFEYSPAQGHAAISRGTRPSTADHLVQDFGHGVRLYDRGDK